MSEAKEHTPTPWAAPEDGTLGSIVDAKGYSIAQAQARLGDTRHKERQANAAFIITACNAYAANQREIAAPREALRRNTAKLHGVASSHNQWLRFDECQNKDCVTARTVLGKDFTK